MKSTPTFSPFRRSSTAYALRSSAHFILGIVCLTAVVSGAFAQTLFTDATSAAIHVAATGNDITGTGEASDPFATLEKALEVSVAGDSILVGPGDYSGNFTINKSDLSISSQQGPASTRITAAAKDSVFFIAPEGAGAVIDGFTVSGGTGRPSPSSYGFDYYGGAINAQASAVVRNCILTGNGAGTPRVNSCTFGGAIYSAGQSEDVVLVENCVLANNFAWASGGASLTERSTIIFDRCTIWGNTSTDFFGNQGGLSAAWSGKIIVRNSILWGNGGSQLGAFGGMYASGTSGELHYSTIQGSVSGGGLASFAAGEGNLTSEPLLRAPETGDFSLSANSPARDAGDPSAPLDPDGTRADMGNSVVVAAALPPGSEWEYSFIDPTTDANWNTTTGLGGAWQLGKGPFGNSVDGFNDGSGTYWPASSTVWVRRKVDFTGLQLSSAQWFIGVDNAYRLYVNGALVSQNGAHGYTYRWEYAGDFGTALVPGVNIIALALDDWGGSTAFDMEITAGPLSMTDRDSDGDGLNDDWERGVGRYEIIEGSFAWDEAKADAEARGGHLATITSQAEWEDILTQIESYPNAAGIWLGGTDQVQNGVWKWVTGETWSFTRWSPSEPNDNLGPASENYLQLYGSNLAWTWNDLPLSTWRLGYLLEFGYPTDPLKADTDDDGYNDKVESDAGTDPNDASSKPMVTVQGGTLPQSSGLAGTTVSTFTIGKYEVTWREWQEVRAWAANNGYTDLAVGAGSSPMDPVRLVNHFDMVKWCNARSEKEGLTPVYLVNGQTYKVGMLYYSNIFSVNRLANGYRLPTEAEWEWAARGGVNSQGFTYSGSNDPDLVAWHRGNSGGAPVDLSEGRGSWPVGSKLANELGLHDMSGNVWEIVSLGGGWTFNRDERGGGWNHDALLSALDFRDTVIGLNVDQGNVDSGFRVARSLDLLPPDADSDGVNDYRENADGTNPNDANSFNPLSKGLVAYYRLNGDSSDESGYGNHAVILGAEATADRFGANSSAFSFDGVGDYMDAPPLISDYQRNFTFSGWIRTTHVSSDRLDAAVSALCKIRDAGDFGGPAIDFREGKAVFTFNNNRVYGDLIPFEEWEYATIDLLAEGNWRHYIMSIDADGLITAFINGQQVASHQISTFLEVTGASPFQIGRAGGAHEAGRYFPGQIDEVRVYNRGLTGAEAWQIYQSEAANLDSDDDGLLDIHETQTGIFVSATDTGSDPYDSDSSDDGLLDGEVVTAGFNPNTSYTPLFNLVKSKSTGDQARIGLFTESAMIDLNLGGIVLRKSGSTVNLRLQIQSKTDLKVPHWTDEGTETFILDMPGNKAFMRIRALGPQ